MIGSVSFAPLSIRVIGVASCMERMECGLCEDLEEGESLIIGSTAETNDVSS